MQNKEQIEKLLYEAEKYYLLGKNSFSKPSKFSNEIIRDTMLMSMERYLTIILLKNGKEPESHTLYGLFAQTDKEGLIKINEEEKKYIRFLSGLCHTDNKEPVNKEDLEVTLHLLEKIIIEL